MTSKKLKDQRKEEAEYIKNGIAESKCSEMKFCATDSEILFVIIDYLIHHLFYLILFCKTNSFS